MKKLKIVIFAATLFILTSSCISFKEKSDFEKNDVDKKPFIGFNNKSGSKTSPLNTEENSQETVWEWSLTYTNN